MNETNSVPDLAAALAMFVTAIAKEQKVPNPGPENLLTVNEAAASLRCSRAFLYARIQSGDLSAVKLGRRRLISTEALREFVARSAA
ncbi:MULTISPECIES: helix-turn-helix domain-containing protein [Mycobacteriaceae]|uniref:Helix-turn-helix domain protein n=1 Tax=Mycobacteroides salmoniphilum TaxID=404941 RepID=A0A4R8SEE7_9MYCO|nr:helix-turn-helix domain-containing protein [Mycobacteroides salmoniphilum]MBA0049320.1 helix-turn-helix domain-containing protein [Mycobacteroides sp. LB1]TDZ94541.1 Helix-turn-helix domain protein [Mycobacteroides salmoniphilum]TEA06005.1 Helix-turn-helix domain protein [Mycobacteroides salmoniphilum]